MKTMGVRGFWGLEQLERIGLTTTRLSLLVMSGSVTIYYLLFAMFWGGIPDWASTALAFYFGTFTGLSLVATLAIARWTQADLESLLTVAPEIQPSVGLLRPNRRLVLMCLLFESILWGGLFYVGRFGTAPISVATLRFWATADGFFLGILLPFTLAASGTLALVVIIRQVNALTYAARHIDIDILELDYYPRLATPLARFVIFALVLVSFAPTVFLLEDAGDPNASALFGMPALVLMISILVVSYAYPVWILRGRIRAAKDKELAYVFRSLRGDGEAMSGSRIGDRGRSLSFSELLDYRGFIESLWDWPLAPHIQGLLLFGLLPPTTWVLAALIENAVSAVMGSG